MYAFSENRVVDSIELEGLERIGVFGTTDGHNHVIIQVVNWQEISQQEKEAAGSQVTPDEHRMDAGEGEVLDADFEEVDERKKAN
ncbi:MAG: hypothetical protein EAZ74_04970 [Alphaproteobacteria bacterium]|nr:MAG: hypothetical protein EAZ74_04970 [Alphaproteobacteria bacterium]